MQKAIVVALCLIIAAACGRVPQTGPEAGDPILFIAQGFATTALDARTHAEVARMPVGVPSPDWKHYYAISGGLLEDYDPMSGQAVRSLPLPGMYHLPLVTSSGTPGGISENGRWLVLEEQNVGGSHLLVIDSSFRAAPVRVDLVGNFEFDAISNDGGRIYLIQRADGDHYYVRDYVVGTGLDPTIIFDKSDGSLAMSGVRLMGVAAPGGSWLFSVYARKAESSFIHELSLDAPIAVCVDLSGPGYADDASAMRWTLAFDVKGGRIFAANGALGVVTEVFTPDTTRPGVSRTVQVTTSAGTAGGALLTPGARSLVLAGAGGVRLLDVATLRQSASALHSWAVVGIALSPGGKSIYAVGDAGQVAELDLSGKVLSTFNSGLAAPAGLLDVQAFS
jgi:hypothetical protein